jgi:hypothetical protein
MTDQAVPAFQIAHAEACLHQQIQIEPPALRLIHNTRGVQIEVFHPEGIEMDVAAYACPNAECNCPDDYYLDISIKIPRQEYDRISNSPGWGIAKDRDDD